MCGIAGFLGRSQPAEHDALLGAMLRSIVHRGPDDEGRWLEPAHGCAFGMRRLSIVDLAGGHQPIWNETGDIGVVFNGEIYNHAELRAGLQARGHRVATNSDTEVLVHLYEEGEPADMLPQLRGMYAFAIIDRRRQRVLFARDPFGQKPLYLRETGNGVAFASEIKALAVPGLGALQRDETRLLDYAAWFSLPAPHTHFRGVTKFAPGEWQLRSFAGALLARGQAPEVRFKPAPEPLTLAAASEWLDRVLDESVKLHLRADVPAGLLLSGGLDSCALATFAQPIVAGSLSSFTAVFGVQNDEAAAAAKTAANLGTHHEEVHLQSEDLRLHIDRVLHHLDEPVADPAAFAVYHLCSAAAAKGIKVLLSGEGSDELLGGYVTRNLTAQHTQRRSAWLRRLLGWLPGTAEAFPEGVFARYLERAKMDAASELICLEIEGLPRNAPSVRGLPAGRLRELRRDADRYARELSFMHADTITAVQQLNLRWQLPESLLAKADRMSMAASVELRCPFLDLRVADLAARLPRALRLDEKRAVGKVLLRHVLERRRPGSSERPKHGFPLPLGRWLRGPLRSEVEGVFRDPGSAIVELMGRRDAGTFWEQFLSGFNTAHTVYALWIYERWRRHSPSADSKA